MWSIKVIPEVRTISKYISGAWEDAKVWGLWDNFILQTYQGYNYIYYNSLWKQPEAWMAIPDLKK